MTLCGNVVWKELAESLDRNIFDEFIWISRKKFNNNIIYKYKILKIIYLKGFEIVIDTTFSREILYGDSIVKTSEAKVKIGSKGSPDSYVKWKRNLLTDKYYSRLISQSSQNIFEFYRNKEFFESLINKKIELLKPKIDVDKIKLDIPASKDFVVIFPGAQEEKRRWSYKKYIAVCQVILKETNFDIVISGSSQDKVIADKIIGALNSIRVFNMAGSTSLLQLAKLISECKILISNETSAVHFAVSVDTKFICLSNGNHFGRFNPYPKEMNVKGIYIYPNKIEKDISDYKFLSKKYRYESNFSINSINPDKVLEAFRESL